MAKDHSELLALVEAGRFDELHEVVSLDVIARAWLAYHRKSAPGGDEDADWWAVELWFEEPDDYRRRAMLESLIEQAVDEDDLANVAAGPLEAYLSDDESTLDWVERLAASSPKVKRALGAVQVDRLSDRAFARIERAAGTMLLRPDREAYERRPGSP